MAQKATIKKNDVDANLSFVFDYKDAYRQIRNYLAGQLVGATRDEALLDEVLKCLFCKLYVKKIAPVYKTPAEAIDLKSKYQTALAGLRKLLPNLRERFDEICLDETSLAFVDDKLEAIDLETVARDPVGDAYETFLGSGIRGQEGQFFTPQNAVNLLVTLVAPQPGERIIDPACGAGGFLSAAARHIIKLGGAPNEVASNIFGIDKDRYLAGLASAHLSLVTLAPAQIYCADSLAWKPENNKPFPLQDQIGTFDVVLANPPFGSRIVAASAEVQSTFALGYKWRVGAAEKRYIRSDHLQSSVAPQVFFIERCLSLVKPGGRVGVVVPESLISSKNYRYVVQYIRDQAHVRAVIGMPESLFKSSGKGGTHTKTCLLFLEKKRSSDESTAKIFMAEAQWCGHDSRGRQIERDEFPEIAARYGSYLNGALEQDNYLGYAVSADNLVDDILAPRYYNPDVNAELSQLAETHELVRLGDLVDAQLIQISSGDEIGKLAYGTGSIPFVRTSDISNWEIKVDPKHGVSEEIYQSVSRKQDVREGDIVMVRDGTYLIGTCAYITKYDTKIVLQSHLYKLRITDHSKLSPYLLLAALSSAPVRRQIKAKRFTQDIIDSLGNRIHELILPLPKDTALRERITTMVERSIQERIEARELARQACVELVGGISTNNGDVD